VRLGQVKVLILSGSGGQFGSDVRRERFKSLILVVLFIISILQVGIIWNNEDHSSPFYFVTKYLNIPQARPERGTVDEADLGAGAKQILLNPFRITLCTGDEHYTVPRSSEEFNKIKETVFLLIEEVMGGRALRKDIEQETWNSLVSRKSILFEFDVPIPLDAVKWAIDYYNTSSDAPENVWKILVIPRESSGVGFYVLTSRGAIQFAPKSVSMSSLEKLYSETLTATDANNLNTIEYSTIHEFGANSYPGFRGDVMGAIFGRKSTLFRNLKSSVLFFVRSAELANTVLGDDINSYSRSNESGADMMIYKNFSNLYRFYSNGIMEYSYIPSVVVQDKGDVYSALTHALVFVQRIKNGLLDEPELYLSGISQDEASWQFTFDYIFGDFPVFFYHELKMMDEVVIQENAVVIRANDKRIISCKWALVDIYFGNDIKELNTAFDTIDVTNISRMSVDDISIVYYFDMTGDGRKQSGGDINQAWPVWRIEDPEGGRLFIPLREASKK